jgi:hypothetical protein
MNNFDLSGARLISIEYGVCADFTQDKLPYSSPFYVLYTFKKGVQVVRDIYQLGDRRIDLVPYLNKIVAKKESNEASTVYTFIDGTWFSMS